LFEVNKDRHDILAGEEITPKNIATWKRILSNSWGDDSREDLLNSLKWIEESGHRKYFDQMGNILPTISEQQYKEMISSLDENERHKWETVRQYWTKLGRKSIISWDYSRYIALCRWGYLVGYLSEKEAWSKIMPVAQILQQTFNSWEDLGKNFLIGRTFWSYEQMQKNGDKFYKAYDKLKTDSTSPWIKIPWDLEL
jgi:hypothetical protein